MKKSELIAFCLGIVVSFLVLFPNIPAYGQDYHVDWITDSEGLPQNSVKSILKDKYGFVWLSTEDGMVRYDGKNFKVFNSTNLQGLKSSRMIFFGGDIEKDTIFNRNSGDELLLIHKRGVSCVQNEEIPAVLHHLDSINSTTNLNEYQVMMSGHAQFMDDISMDYDQYLKTKDKRFKITNIGISGVDFSTGRKYSYQFKESRAKQFFTLGNALYQLTEKEEIYEYKNGNRQRLNTSLTKEATVYTNYIANQVFLYDDGNIYLLQGVHKKSIDKTALFKGLNISPIDIASAYYDEEENTLYLGTYAKGLAVIRNMPITTILDPRENADNIMYGLTAINDSTIVTGTGTVIREGRVIDTNYFKEVSHKYSLLKFGNDELWTTNINMLFGLKYGEDYHFEIDQKWKLGDSVKVTMFRKRDEHSFWVGADYWGNPDKNVLYYKSLDVKDTVFHKVAEVGFNIDNLIKKGKDSLYLGSEENGLYLLTNYENKNPKLEKITSHKNIRSFYRDQQGIWFTTYGQGFYLLKNNSWIKFPLDRKAFLGTAHCIVDDQQGDFWISTNRGLFKIPKKNLQDYIAGVTDQLFYDFFDKEYGLLTNELNGGGNPCGVRLGDGRIYFPSMNGVVSFDPDDLNKSPKNVGLYFDEVKIDGEAYPVGDLLHLEAGFERMAFKVIIPFYGTRNNIHLEVALDNGAEPPKWLYFNPSEPISFTNMDPGSYKLKIRTQVGSNSQYFYNELPIEISPEFWQTSSFRVFTLLLFFSLTFGLFHLRIRHIKKEKKRLSKEVAVRTQDLTETITQLGNTKKELQRQLVFQNSITRSISHDLRTPLKYLNIVSKQLYANPEEMENKEAIKLIFNTGDRLGKFVENILVYAKANIQDIKDNKESVSFYQLMEECISLFEIPLLTQDNQFQNHINPEWSIQTNVQVLKIILQNILDNAIKNTENGKICVNGKIEQNGYVLTIKDSGIGIEREKLKKYNAFFAEEAEENINPKEKTNDSIGLGYRIIKRLLPYVNGEIYIGSVEGGGTTVRVKLYDDRL